jgi:hypothetical protein
LSQVLLSQVLLSQVLLSQVKSSQVKSSQVKSSLVVAALSLFYNPLHIFGISYNGDTRAAGDTGKAPNFPNSPFAWKQILCFPRPLDVFYKKKAIKGPFYIISSRHWSNLKAKETKKRHLKLQWKQVGTPTLPTAISL